MLPFIRLENQTYTLQPGVKVIKAPVYEAYSQVRELTEEAEKKCEKILAQASEEYEKEKERGYREGLARWQEEVLEHQLALRKGTRRYYRKVESEIVQLVVDATQKIIGRFDDTDLIIRLTRQALEQVSQEKSITLRVAPEQVAALRSDINALLEGYPAIEVIDIIADNRLQGADCLLQHSEGTFDASAPVQLNTLRSALIKSLRKEPESR